jgi:hypothetical protein
MSEQETLSDCAGSGTNCQNTQLSKMSEQEARNRALALAMYSIPELASVPGMKPQIQSIALRDWRAPYQEIDASRIEPTSRVWYAVINVSGILQCQLQEYRRHHPKKDYDTLQLIFSDETSQELSRDYKLPRP